MLSAAHQASAVKMEMDFGKDTLTLSISDNGRGFDMYLNNDVVDIAEDSPCASLP